MESSNNIIHPTHLKVLAFGSSCFGWVMMSVIRIETAPIPLHEVALQKLQMSNSFDLP